MADEQKGTVYVVLRQATRSKTEPASGGSMAVEIEAIPDTFEVVKMPATESDVRQAKREREPLVIRAANDGAAIRAAEKETGQKFDHGAVAVPARSWRVRKPKNETITRRLWT